MKWLDSLKNKFKTYRTIKIQIIHPVFTTTDGAEHRGYSYMMDKNCLLCSCGEFMMIDIKERGYIKNTLGTQYPLSNVLSIKWIIESEEKFTIQEKLRNSNELKPSKIYYNTKDVELLRKVAI